MQAELKLKEKRTEEQFEELFTEEAQTVKEIERTTMFQIQKVLETKLIAELQEKLQKLEKKVIEEEETKKIQEETEAIQEEKFCEYGIETESFYHKDKGAYSVKQPYEQDHGNQTGY